MKPKRYSSNRGPICVGTEDMIEADGFVGPAVITCFRLDEPLCTTLVSVVIVAAMELGPDPLLLFSTVQKLVP